MLLRWTAGLALAAGLAAGQSIKDCKSVYLRPMPESLDEFAAVELLKWGAIKVVTVEDKADCVASFGRQASRTAVRSTGSTMVPSDTSVDKEAVRADLPGSSSGIAGDRKAAAMSLTHRASSTIVWADSKADGWSWNGGVRPLAKKLVDQMKKDWSAAK
jgi:hypothetical protein